MLRRSRTVFALALWVLSMQTVAAAQSRALAPAALPFEPTEELVYEGSFTKLILRGVKVAELRFTARRAPAPSPDSPDTQIASTQRVAATPTPPLLFAGEVNSAGFFSRLFGISFRFRISSTVEPHSFVALRTDRYDQQGNRIRTSETVFDRTANQIIWTERDPNAPATQPTQAARLPLGDTRHDILSALYSLRTQPLTPGRTFELVLSDSGRIYRVPVRVAERSRMRTVLGQVPVVRLEMNIFGEGRIVAGEGEMALWITDDARRIPVRARINHSMGTLEINLKQAQSGAPAPQQNPRARTRRR